MGALLRVLPVESHESLCRRCGMSCHPSIRIGKRQVIVPELHCRYLLRDEAGLASCSVYERRHAVAPWCLEAEAAARVGALAHDCPYIAHLDEYGSKTWATEAERAVIFAALRRDLIRDGLTICDAPESAVRILDETDPDGAKWDWSLSEDETVYVFHRIVI